MPIPRLASDSPFHPTQRSGSGRRHSFAVINGGKGRTEDPPSIVVAETPAPEPAASAKPDSPAAATVVDQAPRWWRAIVVLSLRYSRWTVVGWPLYAFFAAWRSYDAKCALDALALRYGNGEVDFDIGLKISEILRHDANAEDLRIIENATRGSRFRPFGLEATFADEAVKGASLFHHMNWVCGLAPSPIPSTISP